MRRASCSALLFVLAATAAACADTPQPPANAAAGVEPGLAEAPSAELSAASSAPVTALWDLAAGRPRRVHGEFVTNEIDAESAARIFLRQHAALFQLRADGRDLVLGTTRRGLAGTYLRFQQVVPVGAAMLPVIDAEVIVLVVEKDGRLSVRDVNLAQRGPLAITAPASDVGATRALAVAREAAGSPIEDAAPEITRAVGATPARVVYRVRLAAESPVAAWEILVDAASGAVLSMRDRRVYAVGSGMVFDPSPIATTGDATLVDNANATSATLDGARYQVSLPNLDGSGYLRGTWVDAHTKNVNARAQSATLTFNYTRADAGFEQVNAYFHIDRAQTRLQSLGFANANAHAQGVISDGQQADNSYYDPAKKVINYGQGGVDDAEDGDIVLHEYGHAIQDDQVPGFGSGGDAGAMGEGFGDYLAATMNRVLSHQVTDPACVGEWDSTAYAMGTPPCLRRTDGPKHFPEFADGEVHDDGEIWSSPLFALDTTLGADVMTRLVIESQFSMAVNESFFAASQAMIDADQNLYAGAHKDALRRRLIQQGVSRILSLPSPLASVITSVPVSIDNPRVNGLYKNLLDDTQTFTQAGAEALRVHFTTIATEKDPTCVDGACDNIYLTDKNGDLYQILSGQQTDVVSVVIPGDTVHIRLVTDPAVALSGYHVDRIDVMGSGTVGTGGGGGAGTTSSSSSASSSSSSGNTASSSSSSSGAGGGATTSSSSSSSSSSTTTSSSSSSSSASSSSSSSTSSSSSSGAGSSSSSSGAGGGSTKMDPGDSGGCGCRAAGEAPVGMDGSWMSLGSALAAVAMGRRRQRKARISR